MRKILPEKLEAGRRREGEWGSQPSNWVYGMFEVFGPCGEMLKIISSGGKHPSEEGWEHVSVSTRRRPPNWQEMCFVKDLFWEDEECVVQYHPPKSDYVNNHARTLHMFRHREIVFPRPPAIMIGVKVAGELTMDAARKLYTEMHQDITIPQQEWDRS